MEYNQLQSFKFQNREEVKTLIIEKKPLIEILIH